jgi:hypothetical protein
MKTSEKEESLNIVGKDLHIFPKFLSFSICFLYQKNNPGNLSGTPSAMLRSETKSSPIKIQNTQDCIFEIPVLINAESKAAGILFELKKNTILSEETTVPSSATVKGL